MPNSTDPNRGRSSLKDADEISPHSRYSTEEDVSACEEPAERILPKHKCHNFVGKENLGIMVVTEVLLHVFKGMISPFRTWLGREIGVVYENEGAGAFQMPKKTTGYFLLERECVRVVKGA